MVILDLKRPVPSGALIMPAPKRVALSQPTPRCAPLTLHSRAVWPELHVRRMPAEMLQAAPVKLGKAGMAAIVAIALVLPLVGGGFAYQAYVKQAAAQKIAKAGVEATSDGLVMAIANGNEELIDAFRKLGIDVATTPRVIEAAVESGSPALLRTVIDAGAKLEREPNARILLARAVEADHADLVQVLAGLGLDIDAALGDGRTLLVLAANQGKWKAFQKLVELNAKIDVPGQGGNSIAHHAVLSNDPAILALLAGKGVDLNKPNGRGETPLLLAVQGEAREVVPALLAAGGDPMRASASGATPFAAAMTKQDDDMVAAFLESRAGLLGELNAGKVGYFLIEKGMVKSAGLMIGKGIELNAVFDDGLTPLGLAAAASQPAIVKSLLEKGADPNMAVTLSSAANVTPLMHAAVGGSMEVVEALLAAGAKVDVVASNGATAYDIAVNSGKAELAARIRSTTGL